MEEQQPKPEDNQARLRENQLKLEEQQPKPEDNQPTTIRLLALDALRGFAILTMVLASAISWGNLPGWMYHAQLPPPNHVFNPTLPGITWVDLVFPFFLFAMGAAIPIALSRKIKEGKVTPGLIFGVLKRGLLLLFFAVVIQNIRPTVLSSSPDLKTYAVALAGFGLLFLVFYRFPSSLSKTRVIALQGAGYAGIVALLAFWSFPEGAGFKLTRFDIIIAVLGNVFVAGSIIWLYTRKNWLWRLGIMALLFAIRLSHNTGTGFIADIAALQPTGQVFNLNFYKYLFIIIPGTIAGDQMLEMMKLRVISAENISAKLKLKAALIIAVMLGFILVSLVSLYNRWVWQGFVAGGFLIFCGYFLFRGSEGDYFSSLKEFFKWGAFWFLLGFLLEPFEGGIKKDLSTMSYYFLTTGLALFFVIGASLIIDFFGWRKGLSLLIDTGQNPMIAYAGGGNLITPLFGLLGITSLFNEYFTTPWLGFIKGVIFTLALAYAVRLFTRYKVFWRA